MQQYRRAFHGCCRDGRRAHGGQRRAPRRRNTPPNALIILPVRNVVMFPGAVFPLTVGRDRSRAAAQEVVRLERPIGVLLQSKPQVDEPRTENMH
ncbi:MAG: LON peptidase substrate-binding domain-containing protein [Casimicrobiaceae bacterium]